VNNSANGAARHRDVGEYVRDEPLTALAIATAAGFVFGKGLNGRFGLAMLAIVGRIALRGVATSLIVGMVAGSHNSKGQDRVKHGSGRDDDGRTNFQKSG